MNVEAKFAVKYHLNSEKEYERYLQPGDSHGFPNFIEHGECTKDNLLDGDGTLQLQFEIELLEEEVLADRNIVKDLDCKMDNVTEKVNSLDGRIAQQEKTAKKTKIEMESLKSEMKKMQALFQTNFTERTEATDNSTPSIECPVCFENVQPPMRLKQCGQVKLILSFFGINSF